MEKASKILVFIFFSGLAYLAWSIFFYQPKVDEVDNLFVVSGRSMEPTFHDGDIVKINRLVTPKPGEVVVFNCLSGKCSPELSPAKPSEELIKRLDRFEKNCFYFLGDNPDHSSDSRNFGALCPDDIEIEGVVVGTYDVDK